MTNKQNPFGDPTPEAVFEAMKQKAMAEAQQVQSGFMRQQQVAQWDLAQRLGQQLGATLPNPDAPTLYLGNPTPFTEGVGLDPPPIGAYLDQFQGVRARMQRLKAALARGDQPNGRDSAAEDARIGLGAALTRAVEAELLTEQAAVAMIVAGGINNEPMTAEQAREQVNAALAQAISAGSLRRGDAGRIADILGRNDDQDRRPAPFLRAFDDSVSQGRARPTGLPPDTTNEDARGELLERARRAAPEPGKLVDEGDLRALVLSVPELLAQIGRLEDLLYAALTVRPCHLAAHGELHRDSPVPCAAQASGTLAVLLAAVDVPPTALPRLPHVDPDGARAACCARDGNLGTWLVYGQTLDPQARFSRA